MENKSLHSNGLGSRGRLNWGACSHLHYGRVLLIHYHATLMPVSQIEHALSMHALGFYVKDHHSFPEKFWGHQTPVYLKLAKEMSATQWAQLYSMLHIHKKIQDRLKEFSKPAKLWTSNPNEYFIAGSNPLEE